MAQGQKRNRALVREAAQALNSFKYEVARDIGLQVPQDDYWGNLPSAQCGAVGGQMVRRMIELAERSLIGGGITGPGGGGAGGVR